MITEMPENDSWAMFTNQFTVLVVLHVNSPPCCAGSYQSALYVTFEFAELVVENPDDVAVDVVS